MLVFWYMPYRIYMTGVPRGKPLGAVSTTESVRITNRAYMKQGGVKQLAAYLVDDSCSRFGFNARETKNSHVCKLFWHNQAIVANEGFAGSPDTPLAILCERDVGPASVSAVQRPLRLAMAGDEDSGRCHSLYSTSSPVGNCLLVCDRFDGSTSATVTARLDADG